MSKSDKSCIFVCSKKSGCGACGANKLAKNLKAEIKDQGLKKKYKVIECSCLGMCKLGVAALCYPENRLITKLGPRDAKYLLNRLSQEDSKDSELDIRPKKKQQKRQLKIVRKALG